MNRRAFLTLPLALAAFPVSAQTRFAPDLLRAGFDSLPPVHRRRVQSELQIAGFYRAAIDGAYGPGTQRALVQGADFVAYNSRGRIRYDLATGQGIGTYLVDLASGTLSAWLYGEGEECLQGC